MPWLRWDNGICARCGESAPKGMLICDECQKIADRFNQSIRKRSSDPRTQTSDLPAHGFGGHAVPGADS